MKDVHFSTNTLEISNICNYILTCQIHVLDMHQMQPKEITKVHEYT